MTKLDAEMIHHWSARDALVLKALAIVFGQRLPVPRRCAHVNGHDESKAAAHKIRATRVETIQTLALIPRRNAP